MSHFKATQHYGTDMADFCVCLGLTFDQGPWYALDFGRDKSYDVPQGRENQQSFPNHDFNRAKQFLAREGVALALLISLKLNCMIHAGQPCRLTLFGEQLCMSDLVSSDHYMGFQKMTIELVLAAVLGELTMKYYIHIICLSFLK
jgi:hypothetical protein